MSVLKTLREDVSTSALVAGFIAVLVSYAGPLAIVFNAAQAANLSPAEISSWLWAISVGSGLTGIILSWKFKMPIIAAWSTPAAALLIVSLPNYSYPEAIGAFVLSGVAVCICGLTGFFQGLMRRIPVSIATAMLAGILFQFGASVFVYLQDLPVLVLPIILTYILCRRFMARYAVPMALLAGLVLALGFGLVVNREVHFALVTPVFTAPVFSLSATMGIALPLFLVTMTSQNVPGVAILQADGYMVNPNPLISVTGFASAVTAPFGSHSLCLAAITAAICTGPGAHPDKDKRYIAGMSCGLIYFVIGLFGSAVAGAFSMLPTALIGTVSGLALFNTISGNLAIAMGVEQEREAALVTFLITASGFSMLNIGAPFWGLVGGMASLFILNGFKPKNV